MNAAMLFGVLVMLAMVFKQATAGVIYVRENESVTIKCVWSSSIIREIQGNIITVVSRNQINPALLDDHRLSLNYNVESSQIILKIRQFSSEYAGIYKCLFSYDNSQTVEDMIFDLRIQKDPTQLTIRGGNSHNFVFVEEGFHTNLTCRVTKGEPSEKLEWSTGNETLNYSYTGSVMYSLVPKPNQHLQLFTCKASVNTTSFEMERSISLFLNLNPDVVITPKENIISIEGNNMELVCDFTSQYQIIQMLWRHIQVNTANRVLESGRKLLIKNIQRQQAGIYECEVESSMGFNRNFVGIFVYYGPDIAFRYFITNHSRILSCIPRGLPTTYTFYQWEHKTEYGDHIEFISGDNDGNLEFPQDISNKYWYKKRGLYVCSVSNGISINGKEVATAEFELNETGKPHFVSAYQHIQYRFLGTDAIMHLYYISFPPVHNVLISQENGSIGNVYTQTIENVPVPETINGRTVRFKGTKMLLTFTVDKNRKNQTYIITISNLHGSSNITIDFRQRNRESIVLSKQIIMVILVSAAVVIVAIVVVGCTRKNIKSWMCQRLQPTSSSSQQNIEGRVHYDDIDSVYFTSVLDDGIQAESSRVVPVDSTESQIASSIEHAISIHDIAGIYSDQMFDSSTDNSDSSYTNLFHEYTDLNKITNRCNSFHDYERIARKQLYRFKHSTVPDTDESDHHLKRSTI